MTRRLRAVGMALLFLGGLMVVPSTSADCPEVPHHCRADALSRLLAGESKSDVGVYEDDPPIESNTKGFVLSEQGLQESTHSSDGDGKLEVGETGGVLIIINDTGNASSLTFTLDPNPTGISYLNGNSITINNPVAGEQRIIRFEVDQVTDGLALGITMRNDQGQQGSGVLFPFGLPDDPSVEPSPAPPGESTITLGQWIAIGLVALVALMLVSRIARRLKK